MQGFKTYHRKLILSKYNVRFQSCDRFNEKPFHDDNSGSIRRILMEQGVMDAGVQDLPPEVDFV